MENYESHTHLFPEGGQLLVHHAPEPVRRQLLVARLQRGPVPDPLPHLHGQCQG